MSSESKILPLNFWRTYEFILFNGIDVGDSVDVLGWSRIGSTLGVHRRSRAGELGET